MKLKLSVILFTFCGSIMLTSCGQKEQKETQQETTAVQSKTKKSCCSKKVKKACSSSKKGKSCCSSKS